MKPHLFLSLLLLVGSASVTLAQADKAAAKSSTEAGFVSLFDGQSLQGWTLIKGRGPGYVVKDGTLVCPLDVGGNLYTA